MNQNSDSQRITDQLIHEVLNSKELLSLERNQRKTAGLLCFFMMGSYFSFILTIALNKEFFVRNQVGSLPLSLVVGVGLILLAWVLTGVYVVWANFFHDDRVQMLRRKIGGSH